ncbi:MAG: hypothetical protein ACTTKL_08080 [Treponema sp.]
MKNFGKSSALPRKTAFIFFAGSILSLFASCATLQDVVVNFDGGAQFEDIRNIEEKLCKIDARAALTGDAGSKQLNAECEKVLEDIDGVFAKGKAGKAESARLWALRGQAQLLSGAKARAQASLKEAKKLSRDDTAAAILAFRLGSIQKLDLDSAQNAQDKARLTLENAVSAYKSGEFMTAAAYFDSAFIDLPEYYRSSYKELRARSWELRAVSGGASEGLNAVLQKKEITAGQMLLIAQDTGTLLYNYTAGKKLSESQLYAKTSAAGLLSPLSGEKKRAAAKDEIIARIKCARFLWNLYSSKKGRSGSAQKYSARYRATELPSPVADVPADSEDFDAVLGSVENELMELPDGEHFEPDKKVSAPECRVYLENLLKRMN